MQCLQGGRLASIVCIGADKRRHLHTTGTPNGHFVKVSQTYEHKCLNMKFIYYLVTLVGIGTVKASILWCKWSDKDICGYCKAPPENTSPLIIMVGRCYSQQWLKEVLVRFPWVVEFVEHELSPDCLVYAWQTPPTAFLIRDTTQVLL